MVCSCGTENLTYIICLSTCTLEDLPKHSGAYANTDSGNESCDFSWRRSTTEGLWVAVLVGHVGKGQEEPWRKAKVGPRGHG